MKTELWVKVKKTIAHCFLWPPREAQAWMQSGCSWIPGASVGDTPRDKRRANTSGRAR